MEGDVEKPVPLNPSLLVGAWLARLATSRRLLRPSFNRDTMSPSRLAGSTVPSARFHNVHSSHPKCGRENGTAVTTGPIHTHQRRTRPTKNGVFRSFFLTGIWL